MTPHTFVGADDLQSEYVLMMMNTSMVWGVWDTCVWPVGASKVFLICAKRDCLPRRALPKMLGPG